MKIVSDDLFTGKEKQKLLKRIYETLGEDVKVDIQLVNEIPVTKSGKHRLVISRISHLIR